MNNSYSLFCKLIQEINIDKGLYYYISNQIGGPVDASDLLRWQWVQSVSALDKLIHDLVRIGMVQEYQGIRPATSAFNTFPLNMQTELIFESNPMFAPLEFESVVRKKFGTMSFQDPLKIADALAYIWIENHKWKEIATQLGMPENACKEKQKNIVIRRNQIVHEADYQDILGVRQSLTQTDVNDVVDFEYKLGTAIFQLVH